jgi:hypothetical protein
MQTLEILYEQKIQPINFLERKIKITNRYTILVGAKLSGKTYLIYDYILNQKQSYLYIDMNNLKDLEFHSSKLQVFIDEKDIKMLVIENYDYSFKLPKVNSIILSCPYFKDIKIFKHLKIMPLDFEEYLSFDTKHQHTTNSFNSFLKYGNIPEIVEYKDIKKQNRNKEIIQLIDINQTKYQILNLLIKNSSQAKSPFWIYTILKKHIKISKDFLYKTIKQFEQNYTILTCPKYNHPKAVKKIFCYNYAFLDTVSFTKRFANVLTNMIFLELYNRYEDIYYDDNVDFYIPSENTIILSIPFYNTLQISNITTKILKAFDNLEFNTIYIVTISNQDEIYVNDILCDIVPFYEWALMS